ncbi:MAG TPA: phosphatase PAP2 family protein [Acidimicrobiales bacterium]|nr:phosphatase PAP2 family protein [Acidimicrobiales bacterium]
MKLLGPQRAVVVGAVALGLLAGACGSSKDTKSTAAASGGIPAEAKAGNWKPWVLTSADQIKVPAPPKSSSAEGKAEVAELKDLAAKRTPQVEQDVHKWSDYPSLEPWTKENMQLVSEQSKNPPLASRGYSLVSVAMYDATIAAYHWKYVYNRAAPSGTNPVVPAGADPSYPDDHAAIAGAASRVLAYLFPEKAAAAYDAEAEAAADSRVAGGENYRSDTDAGLALGRAVADVVIARAKADGSDKHFDGQIPTGPDHWAPDPGTSTGPTEPLAGTWKTWVVNVVSLRPGPPPAYGSPQFLKDAQEVVDVTKNLTADQKRIADFWKDAGGTPLPPGHWNQIALDTVRPLKLSTPALTRTFALLNIALSDAGNAAWDTKYAYWSPRPINAIRDLGIDPTFTPYIRPTPSFPSYISGHSTYSSAASQVLGYLFPDQAKSFDSMAQEAAMSRLYGGIHFRTDNEVGFTVGTKVGQQVVDKARQDGAA